MNAPNVRSATVRLNAEVAAYIAKMKAAGQATDDAFSKVHARMAAVNRDTKAAQTSMDGLTRSATLLDKRLSRSATIVDTLDKRLVSTTSSMDRLTTASSRTDLGVRVLERDTVRLGTSTERTGNLVDRASGRLRLYAEAAVTAGLATIPLGSTAVVGVAGLAGLFGSATVGALGLAAATQGVGDALKAVGKARLDPTIENLQAAEEAMARITPEAREWVRRVQEVLPVLKRIRDAGAAELFPGLTASIDDFERLEPVLSRFMAGVGAAGGDAVANAAESLSSDRWAPFLDFLADEAPDAITSVSTLVGDLAHGASELWMAFDPGNDRFVDWLLDVGDAFDRYASSSEGREDIVAFLNYAQKNGPKVAEFLGATATAITEVVQAAAPLGGPTLEILTAVAKVVGSLAASDLATPVLAGVAAYSALNRVLLITQATQAKLMGSAAASGGIAARGGLFGAISTGAATARTGVRQLGRDLGTMAVTSRSSARGLEHVTQAAARTKSTLATVGKGAAVLGGLTIAATGAAEGLGLTNTASLGLMGTLGGQWGAAIGAAIGFTLDMAAANDNLMTSLEQVDDVAASGDIDLMRERIAEFKAEIEDRGSVDSFGDALGDIKSDISDVFSGDFTGNETIDKIGEGISGLQTGISQAELALRAAQRANDGYASTVERAGLAAVEAAYGVDALAVAIRHQQDAARGAINFDYAWGQAIIDLRDRVKEGEDGFNEFTKAGQENFALIRQGAEVFNEAAPKEQTAAAYERVREQLVAFAKDLGAGNEFAQELVDTLLNVPKSLTTEYALQYDRRQLRDVVDDFKSLPPKVQTEIRANGIPQTKREIDELVAKYKLTEKERQALVNMSGNAIDRIQVVLSLLDRAHGYHATSTITLIRETVYKTSRIPQSPPGGGNPLTDPVGGGADGTTVPKTGRPYADRHVYLLADGEEVVSNRYGQADRHRPLLKAINADRLAGGGTTGPAIPIHTRRSDNEVEREQRRAAQGLKDLTGRVKEAEKAVERERKQRDALVDRMKQVSSGISTALTSELGASGGGGPWSSEGGGTLAGNLAIVQGDTREARRFGRLVDILKEKGFDGAALEDLLARGDINEISSYASASRGQLRQFEQAFNERARLVRRESHQGADAALGKRLDAANDELREANRELRQIKNHVKQGNKDRKTEHGKDRDSQRQAVGNGARNRRRDPL